jgi:hypothetical protein
LLLTLIKESYLLLANTYGFLVHPQRTYRKLRKDRSQMALFTTLGFSVVFFGLVFYWLIRRFFF